MNATSSDSALRSLASGGAAASDLLGRERSGLERLLFDVLVKLGWHRSGTVFDSALPSESRIEHLEEAAMLLSLFDVPAVVEPGFPRAWKEGVDGTVVAKSGVEADAIVRVNGIETTVSTAGKDQERVRSDIQRGGRVLFIRRLGSGDADVLVRQWLMGSIRRGVRRGLFLSFFINVFAALVPIFIMVVFDRVLGARAPESLWPLVSGAATVVLCIALLRWARARFLAAQFARFSAIAGSAAENRLIRMPLLALQTQSNDRIEARIGAVRRVAEVFASSNTSAIFDAPFVLVSILLIGFLGGILVLVPAIYLLLFVAIALLVSRSPDDADPVLVRAARERAALLHELSTKAPEIRETRVAPAWLSRLTEHARLAARGTHKLGIRSAAVQSLGSILGTGAALATLAAGVGMAISGAISSGGLVATMLLTWRITGPAQAFFVALPRLRSMRNAILSLEQSLAIRTMTAPVVALEPGPYEAPSLEVRGVFFRYDAENDPALTGVTFRAGPGSVTAIIGPNGAGKTTLLQMLSGALTPQSGQVLLNGVNLRQYDPDELALTTLILPALSGRGADSGTPWSVSSRAKWDPRATIDHVVSSALGPHGALESDRPATLPPCELEPPFVLLDDPTGCADAPEREAFLSFLTGRRGHSTIFFSTHDTSLLQAADNAIVLSDGALRYFGPVECGTSDAVPQEGAA